MAYQPVTPFDRARARLRRAVERALHANRPAGARWAHVFDCWGPLASLGTPERSAGSVGAPTDEASYRAAVPEAELHERCLLGFTLLVSGDVGDDALDAYAEHVRAAYDACRRDDGPTSA